MLFRSRPDLIVHSADGNFAIRRGQKKWIEGVPAEDVKAASKKARAEQMQRMLFDLRTDISESRDLAAQEPAIATELETLLNRYRNAGYSRELPPLVEKPQPKSVTLAPLSGEKLLDLPLDKLPPKPWANGSWADRDGAVWMKATDKGSPLTGPLNLQDGVIEFQLRLGDADRHSLRIHTQGNAASFRIVLSRTSLDISRNPPPNEPANKAVSLGKQRVKFNTHEWQTLRLTFKGEELTAEIAGEKLTAKDPILGELKSQMHLDRKSTRLNSSH